MFSQQQQYNNTGSRNARVAKISDFGLSVLVGFEEQRSRRLSTLTSMRNTSSHGTGMGGSGIPSGAPSLAPSLAPSGTQSPSPGGYAEDDMCVCVR